MAFDYLTPDSFQPQDASVELDPIEMYKKKLLGQRWRPPARPGGGALTSPMGGGGQMSGAMGGGGQMSGAMGGGGQMSGANTATTRAFYNQLSNKPLAQQPDAARYFSPNPDDYIGTNQETPPAAARYVSPSADEYVGANQQMPPNAAPSRGGFNQAEGLASPDYSRGDDLRKQAYDLQHPSLWKKLVNGDGGLAQQAEQKYRLAQYEDLAANNKYRFDHPEAFKDNAPKLVSVAAGNGLWDANASKWAVPPQAKPDKPEPAHQFASGGKLWSRKDSASNAEPVLSKMPRPDDPGPNPDGSAGYTGEVSQQLDAPETRKGNEWSKLFDKVNDDGTVTVGERNNDTGDPRTTTFGNAGKKTQGKAASGQRADWTPKDLEKIATKNAADRRRAEGTMDPVEIQRTEDRITARLNSGGLEEDDTTGEVRPAAPGGQKPTVGDVRPGDTIRNVTARKTPIPETTTITFDHDVQRDGKTYKKGTQFKKLRGRWEPFTGTGKQ